MQSQKSPPCTLVIFGARGDLTKRLLMPALYNLAGDDLLDDGFRVIGVDHGDIDTAKWISTLSETMQSFTKAGSSEFSPKSIDEANWSWITEKASYLRGDFDQSSTYEALAEHLRELQNNGASKNVIFYVASSPSFFARVADGLGNAELLTESDGAFRRVVIEKPFGHDEESAKELHAHLRAHAEEQQIYRIDHYMGKDAVRSMLYWRFANQLFEPIWNGTYIDHVQITAAETLGVGTRGGFYEKIGALRDMVPSHLFTVMSIIAMEQPQTLDRDEFRDAYYDVVASIAPISADQAARGQYRAGTVEGKPVPAYRDVDRVDRQSRTETYAALHLKLNNARWRGVPFYFRTGKALSGRETSVEVVFKQHTGSAFASNELASNFITFRLSGGFSVATSFVTKLPGIADEGAVASSNFRVQDAFKTRPTVGYEKLLYDCMDGSQMFFLRQDSVEAAWHALQPVLDAWAAGGEPQPYTAGSSGPSDSDALLAASGRQWLPID